MTNPITFFKQAPKDVSKSHLTTIDLGGAGDCGFRSIAACILDFFNTHRPMDSHLLNKLLAYYPDKDGVLQKITSTEAVDRMRILSKSTKLNTLIVNLGIALRTIAVTEMRNNPRLYPGAFVGQHENTSPEQMLKPETWIDETAISAVANALNIDIVVKVKEQYKELPASYKYGPGKEKSEPIFIELANGHYKALVHNANYFKDMNIIAAPPVKAVDVDNFPDMKSILAAIEIQNKESMDTYHKNYSRLLKMFEAKEIDNIWLRDSYITCASLGEYLNGHLHHCGNTEFYNNLCNKANLSIDSEVPNYTKMLMHALSQAITIGEVTEEQVFGETLEQQVRPS